MTGSGAGNNRGATSGATRWLSHPVLLVDQPDDDVEQFTWIEATSEITAENAEATFRAQLPDTPCTYAGVPPREVIAVTGPHYHVPYHPEYGDGDVPVPLDYESDDLYFCERVWWTPILLPASNAVPLWRLEWSDGDG